MYPDTGDKLIVFSTYAPFYALFNIIMNDNNITQNILIVAYISQAAKIKKAA